MYLPSSTCGPPPGLFPDMISPARMAAMALLATELNSANTAWQTILRRQWQDFSDLGPAVAIQVMNSPISPSPYPVVTVAPSSSTPSSSTASSSGVSGWRRRGLGDALNSSQSQFVAEFGGSNPWETYIGPLPMQGTPMSLTYGGSPTNRLTVLGTHPPPAPDATAGYYSAACLMPQGVNSAPPGEVAAAAVSSAAAAGPTWYWLAALLGLALAGHVAGKRSTRRAAK